MKSKIGTLLLSIVLAFCLWLYVVTVVGPESDANYYDIPVVFDGIAQLTDRNLMITSDTDVTVDLQLSGNRTDLIKLDKTNITVLADLSQIREAGEHKVKYTISSSAGAFEVLNRDPEYITVHVSERVQKEVPVQINYIGSVPDNFSADIANAVLDHKSVTISGPKEVVDQIASAWISVDLTQQMDTIVQSCRHTLCGSDGQPIEDVSAITVNVSDIRVTIRVYQIKEVPLVIYVENGGGITQDMVTITPNRTSITLSGNRSDMEKIDKIVLGTINLGDLEEDTKQLIFDIPIPEGITNVTGVTQVTVDVQMPVMEMRSFQIKEFMVVGVPSGRQVQLITEALIVKVRGPAELLDKITAEDILAVVDCSEQQLLDNAPNNLLVTITIPGMEGIGPLGEYYVTAYVGVVIGGSEIGE